MAQMNEDQRRAVQHSPWSNEGRTAGSHEVLAPAGARPIVPSDIYNAVMMGAGQPWTGLTLICSPPCDCLECQQQYRCREEQMTQLFCIYAGSYEDMGASSLAKGLSSAITQNLHTVRTILKCHGQLIHKRWTKKKNHKAENAIAASISRYVPSSAYPDPSRR